MTCMGVLSAQDVEAAEARGFARGIEAAAKWHEDRARICGDTMGAEYHKRDAAAIRALANMPEPPR